MLPPVWRFPFLHHHHQPPPHTTHHPPPPVYSWISQSAPVSSSSTTSPRSEKKTLSSTKKMQCTYVKDTIACKMIYRQISRITPFITVLHKIVHVVSLHEQTCSTSQDHTVNRKLFLTFIVVERSGSCDHVCSCCAFVNGCLLEVVVGHPWLPRVRAPVYSKCGCQDPLGCSDAQAGWHRRQSANPLWLLES